MEFTGFQDKNGTDIHEHETVKLKGKKYEVCQGLFPNEAQWVLDGKSGRVDLEKVHDQVEIISENS